MNIQNLIDEFRTTYDLGGAGLPGFEDEEIQQLLELAQYRIISQKVGGNNVYKQKFPDTGVELREFKCPGIVFFLQPGELEDSVAVFDEYIDTIELVADKLDGVKLDSKRDPLTDKTISEFRNALT